MAASAARIELMVAAISIVIALSLLGLTIYGLHHFQSKEVKHTVERSMPLPSLEAKSGANLEPRYNDRESAPGSDSPADETKNTTGSNSRLRPDNWLARVNELKKHDKCEQALELCIREFPLWSAYNQACILYRAKIKSAQEAGQPIESLLGTLYRTAAQAEMLHEVTAGSPKLRLEQLRRLDLSRLSDLEFPYHDIGYTQLRLVRKHDIKMMQQLWGRPRQHSTPRQLHESTWESMRTAIG